MAGDNEKNQNNKKILIVGGGFAGMTSALLLGEQGFDVTIVEKEAAVGGFFPLLDTTFPTNSCGVCFLSPKQPAYCPFIECELAERIAVKTASRVTDVAGGEGGFLVTLESETLGVDQGRCIDCGECAAVCPVAVPFEFSGGIETRKAIYKQYPKMLKTGYRVDLQSCTRCGACVEACPVDAITLENGTTVEQAEYQAVLLTPGFSLVAGDLKGEYGFGRYANVVSARQLERMVSFSGPSGGKVYSPADGSAPKRVAFIQCVGSRDITCGRGYCSSVCCMYTAKQASLIRERSPETEVVVYYIDVRGMGKGYEKYLSRVREELGVEYRRSMVSTVKEDPRSRKLRLVYEEDGEFVQDEADLVVLSLGFDAPRLGFLEKTGVELDKYGFCRTGEFAPAQTSVPGIFAAGAFCGPKDIPETVMEAAAAADAVAVYLAGGKPVGAGEEERRRPGIKPAEGGFWAEEPRIGVFLCACSGVMAERLDYNGISERLLQEPRVLCVEIVDHLCSPEGPANLRRFIGTHELNRIVVGGCSARLMSRLFERLAQEIGFNANAFNVVDLQHHCLFPHGPQGGGLRQKAFSLLKTAVKKVMSDLPAVDKAAALEQSALVIGGGVAGMTTALSFAARGHGVFLVEATDKLGGRLNEGHYTLKGSSPRELAASLSGNIAGNPRIEVLMNSEVVDHWREKGSYVTSVQQGEETHLIRHGVMVVATGGREAQVDEYLMGTDNRVITQTELEERIALTPESLARLRSVVMIQCVGSREHGKREYCSRVCCTHALKNALKLKNANPDVRVTVLYRDMRSYGLYEDYYRLAREAGVLFTPYNVEQKPIADATGEKLRLAYYDRVLHEEIVLEPDLLVLSTGIEPTDNSRLAEILNLPLDEYGFFQESNSKAAAVDFVGEGRYHCGLASAPLHIEESVIRAMAAASRGSAVLKRETIPAPKTAVLVNTRLCSGCGLCVESCPYNARELDPEDMIAHIHYDLCHGCGICSAVCPNGATEQVGFRKAQIMNMADEIMR